MHVAVVGLDAHSQFTSFAVEMFPADLFPGVFTLSDDAQLVYDATIGADFIFNETSRPRYERFAADYGTHFCK